VIAALQGGMLLARVRGDVTPLRDALDSAVAQLHRWEATTQRRPRRARRSARDHRAS
jgi:microcompartment protein CcmL/EutN